LGKRPYGKYHVVTNQLTISEEEGVISTFLGVVYLAFDTNHLGYQKSQERKRNRQ